MKRVYKSAKWRVLWPGPGLAAANEGLKSKTVAGPGMCADTSRKVFSLCALDLQHQRAEKGSGQSRRGCVSVPECGRSPRWRELLRRQKRRVVLPALSSQTPERWKQVILQDAFDS